MVKLVRTPWGEEFQSLVRRTRKSLVLASPYVGGEPCAMVADVARRQARAKPLSLLLLTNLSSDALLSGAVDPAAIADLVDAFRHAEVRVLASLHAKVYVADEREAIVTSGNMTAAGLWRNLEYGVAFSDVDLVRSIRRDILSYAQLGTRVDAARLRLLAEACAEVRETKGAAESTMRRSLRQAFEGRLAELEVDVLRARTAGRSAHAMFADAIMYLLSERPMRTAELHPLIQQIHPDLCDDSVHRVIDGEHYGKKWKHAVRTAQQFLKRRGLIELAGERWRLVPGADTDGMANS